ncbi:MAG: sialidase family protein [Erythrobacter sp.]|jgi:hypothetical protein
MIIEPLPIEAPGDFAPVTALGYDDGTGFLALVSTGQPLPTVALAPAAPAALEGTTAAAQLAGPFVPTLLAPVYLALSGSWTGQVRVLRSTDGGATLHPLTLGGAGWATFAANACEPVWVESEAGAALYLELAPQSGTIAYRVSQ